MENIANVLSRVITHLVTQEIPSIDNNFDSPHHREVIESTDKLYQHITEDNEREEWFAEIEFCASFETVTRHITSLFGEPSHPKSKSHPEGNPTVNNWTVDNVLIVHTLNDTNSASFIEGYEKVSRHRE